MIKIEILTREKERERERERERENDYFTRYITKITMYLNEIYC